LISAIAVGNGGWGRNWPKSPAVAGQLCLILLGNQHKSSLRINADFYPFGVRFGVRFQCGNLVCRLPGQDENPKDNFRVDRLGPGRVIIWRQRRSPANLGLPSGSFGSKMVTAMGFANPFKGEPPDDFRADNSYRKSANARSAVGFFYALILEPNHWRLTMQIPHDAVLLRIFIGESDRWHHQPLYEALVLKAREMHLAGATVLRGPMGFGKSSRMHTAKILRLSMDLPLVIEMVDSEEKINLFLPVLDEMMKGGLVTLEKARVIDYRADVDTGAQI
jgi:hypothetical protein